MCRQLLKCLRLFHASEAMSPSRKGSTSFGPYKPGWTCLPLYRRPGVSSELARCGGSLERRRGRSDGISFFESGNFPRGKQFRPFRAMRSTPGLRQSGTGLRPDWCGSTEVEPFHGATMTPQRSDFVTLWTPSSTFRKGLIRKTSPPRELFASSRHYHWQKRTSCKKHDFARSGFAGERCQAH